MKIRKAESRDIEEMSKLYKIVADTYAPFHPIFEEHGNAGMTASRKYIVDMDLGTAIVFVAEDNGKITGFIGAQQKLMPETFKTPFTLHITDVAVYPEYRGMGIGLALVRRMVEWAKEEKVRYVTLSVGFEAVPALKTYIKAGFKDLSKDMVLDTGV